MSKKLGFIAVTFLLVVLGCTDDDTTNAEQDCPGNVKIGLENATATSVMLKWLETQGFSSNYEYGEKGFVLGTGTKGSTAEEKCAS